MKTNSTFATRVHFLQPLNSQIQLCPFTCPHQKQRKFSARMKQMASLTESKAGQATLGSLIARVSSNFPTSPAQTYINTASRNAKQDTRQVLFRNLPAELHISIIAHLHGNPVSQICLDLTFSHWHEIFHEVGDER